MKFAPQKIIYSGLSSHSNHWVVHKKIECPLKDYTCINL